MSKLGAVGRGLYAFVSMLVRLCYKLLMNVALVISFGVAVYTVGDCTRRVLKDKKEVLDILYWRDPKKSGIALGVILLVIFLACKFTFLSLISNLALLALAGALGFRVFKLVEAQIKKTDGANPFNPYLQHELDVPQDRIHAQVDVLVENGRNLAVQLRRLFLCENICESVKFGLFLWTLTYVGAWFSGQALVILFVLGCFSVPKVYEIYKEPIDANLAVARENVEKVHALVADKLPFLKCGGKAESKKEE